MPFAFVYMKKSLPFDYHTHAHAKCSHIAADMYIRISRVRVLFCAPPHTPSECLSLTLPHSEPESGACAEICC